MSALTPPDPYRIKRILNKLESAWMEHPDFTLQNILWSLEDQDEVCDDEKLENALDSYLKDHKLSAWKS